MEKWQDLRDMLETMLLWLIIWLNLQVGKMKQILFFDWLPEQESYRLILPTLDLPYWSCKNKLSFGHIMNLVLT